MKRRRSSLAAGLFVALVGLGGPTKASSDSFGKKIPPPPPPRPTLANQGFHESPIRSTSGGSANIIPPPPPRQQLNGKPPPRIPPPPQRASQSIQWLKTQDQLQVPPPPPRRTDESSSVEDNGYSSTVSNELERATREEAESIEHEQQPQTLKSEVNLEGIGSRPRRVPPPPPPRPVKSNVKDNDFVSAAGDISERPTKDEPESIGQVQQPQEIVSKVKLEVREVHQRRLPPPPPPRPDGSNVGAALDSASEQSTKEEDGKSAEPVRQQLQQRESKVMPNEIELDQRRVPPPPPRPIESRVTYEEFRISLERPARDETGSIELVLQPPKMEPNVKPEDIEDNELNPSSTPAEEEKELYDLDEPQEGLQMPSDISEESLQEPENEETENSEPMIPQKDVTSSIESSRSKPHMKSSQDNGQPQNKGDFRIIAQLPSPLIISGPDSNKQAVFIRSQIAAQRSAPQLERTESRQHSQQEAFTLPLTHQHPMQPNPVQQQNQQGYYRQVPNPQHQQPRRAPPTNVRRSSPRSPSGSTPSFFKNILRNAERGLDELSTMDDKIAKRAQRLVSNAASSSGVNNVVQFGTKWLSPKSSSSAHSSSKRTKIPPSKAPVSTPPSDKSPFSHLGKKYESANGGTMSSSQPAVTQKLIRANGGASAPGGQTPNQPIPPIPLPAKDSTTPEQSEERQQQQQGQQQPQQQQLQRQQGQQQQYSQPPSQGTGRLPGAQSPYGANPFNPATESQKKPDLHSRESRIPWEISKTGTSRPSQTRMPVMNSFEEDDASWKEKLLGALPRLPRLPNPAKLFRFRKNKGYQYANMDAWKDDDYDSSRRGLFGFFKKKSSSDLTSRSTTPQTRLPTGNSESTKTPIDSLMERSNGAKTTSLLATSDKAKCRSLGRYHATFDLVQVMFLILGMQQLSGLEMLTIPTSLFDLVSKTIPVAVEIVRDSMTTWAPFWFAYALLTKISRKVMLESKVENLASEVGASVEEDSVYGQLYLRLIASTPMDTRLLSHLSEAARSEVRWTIAKARLSAFATFVAGVLLFMTASVLRPAMMVVGKTALDLVTLQELRSWPIEWKSLWNHLIAILTTSFKKLETLFANVLVKAMEKPLDVAYHLSIFAALLLATMIPKIESKKTVPAIDDEEEEMEVANENLDQISRLGASSATRLTMLSENGSVENVLERWRTSNVPPAVLQSSIRLSQVLRQMCFTVLAGLTSFAPLLIPFLFEPASSSPGLHMGLQWDSMLDVSVILASVFMLIWIALKQSTVLQASLPYVKSFLSDLSKTMEEIAASNKQQADLKLSASISANAGLAVRDLWAAHTTKRAWAVRGANLECRNGEVLAVLGDDSSGKTRLLTTIAESLITPPKRSRTSNKVRGLVAIGGLDASKWDKVSLKRRLGILLSDVCTLGDTASIFSGWTLEEILEPVDGVQPYPRTLASNEKSAILLGLKITGLYDTLLRRLPSKMNTVITGNEEDLGKTSVDPSTTVLSPAEWSKLLLAKVIAQTISDNDNVMASTDKIENSLMGSVLILDDVAVLLSEVEEAKVIRELRQTGAATVISSNKWATGRFADRIAVVKGGAVVEVGTHNELIARGPQRSLYAAKWHAMTMG